MSLPSAGGHVSEIASILQDIHGAHVSYNEPAVHLMIDGDSTGYACIARSSGSSRRSRSRTE